MPRTKLRFDWLFSKADSGYQSRYSLKKKARQGVGGGYPEGRTSAAFVVSLGAPRRCLFFGHF